jgi:NTE family protein
MARIMPIRPKRQTKAQPAAGCPVPGLIAGRKPINLALQGGGAHGAFAWGVIDRLLEDGRIDFDGISGTSAGSMNAVVFAYGRLKGGHDGAREALENFWKAVSDAGQRFSPVRKMPWETMLSGWNGEANFAFEAFKLMTNAMSPYQWNPLNFNPLLDIVKAHVDFDELNHCKNTKLFLSATNVHSGKVRVFNTHEVTADAVMASACLPFLFQAVEIDGEPYWDGGYMGNPSLFPLFYGTTTRDVLIVHINPIERPHTPKTPVEIYDRVNEISFNSSLIKELRAIAFVQKLVDQGWLKDEYKKKVMYVLVHSLRADEALADCSVASKFENDWKFLTGLRDRGRAAAAAWLKRNFDDIGVRSTVDLHAEYLTSGSEMDGKAYQREPTHTETPKDTSKRRRTS